MKIATKTGDFGTTGLLFGGRVLKSDFRIELVGLVDELSSFIGMVKVELNDFLTKKSVYFDPENAAFSYQVKDQLDVVQKDFINLMGEIAIESDKKQNFYQNYPILDSNSLSKIELQVDWLEAQKGIIPNDWVLYGHNRVTAQLDVCSKITRRVERAFWAASISNGYNFRSVILQYLNRLSDYFYLLARFFTKIYI